MSKVVHYRDLHVWNDGVALAVLVYRVTDVFPKVEQFGLTHQMRRAAVSIPSNIAEGHRRSDKEFGRFLEIARGSLAELETQIEIAIQIDYLKSDNQNELVSRTGSVGRQLSALLRTVSGNLATRN